MNTATINTVIFDLSGVLVNWEYGFSRTEKLSTN